jgi:hypothetical protein
MTDESGVLRIHGKDDFKQSRLMCKLRTRTLHDLLIVATRLSLMPGFDGITAADTAGPRELRQMPMTRSPADFTAQDFRCHVSR